MPTLRCLGRAAAVLTALGLLVASAAAQPWFDPRTVRTISPQELTRGQKGEVWTVFAGTTSERFEVEFVGVVENYLGPGSDIILCRLTDPRVQEMGAVAGMSGSPLYFDGRLAGALSYRVQIFETVRHAGFTPIADILEVARFEAGSGPARDRDGARAGDNPGLASLARLGIDPAAPAALLSDGARLEPLQPAWNLSGLSPRVTALMAPEFNRLGLRVTAGGGGAASSAGLAPGSAGDGAPLFLPGDAAAVALTTGDITLAGTGTVSYVDGPSIYLFGHPMFGLGEVDLPLTRAEIVTVASSSYSSFKISNARTVVGSVSQDRLAAVYGRTGRQAPMVEIEVALREPSGERTIRFAAARDPDFLPVAVQAGALEALFNRNAAQRVEGWRATLTLDLGAQGRIERSGVIDGDSGYAPAVIGLLRDLRTLVGGDVVRLYPDRILVRFDPLAEPPGSMLERLTLDRAVVRAGERVTGEVAWRDTRGAVRAQRFDLPAPAHLAGRTVELVAVSPADLDALTGRVDGPGLSSSRRGQPRTAQELVASLGGSRPADGLHVALVARERFLAAGPAEGRVVPDSVARIARQADPARHRLYEAAEVLAEQRIAPGRDFSGALRSPITFIE